MRKKTLALLLTLILLVLFTAGCLPQIMQQIVGAKIEEMQQPPKQTQATQEMPIQETPARQTPLQEEAILPTPTVQPAPSGSTSAQAIEAVYSRPEYVRIFPDYSEEFDLNGDGAMETLSILENSGAPDSEMLGITVNHNGQEYFAEVGRGYVQDAFVAYNADAKPCIVVSFDYASADYQTVVYTFDGRSLTCTNTIFGFVDGVYEGVWMLRSGVYTLGTWDGYHKYALSSSFTFEPEGPDLWLIQNAGLRRALTAKVTIPARFFENGVLVPGEIQPGERLLPYATDEREIVYFRMEDGRTGALAIEFREGATYINGEQDELLFDNVQYSG